MLKLTKRHEASRCLSAIAELLFWQATSDMLLKNRQVPGSTLRSVIPLFITFPVLLSFYTLLFHCNMSIIQITFILMIICIPWKRMSST